MPQTVKRLSETGAARDPIALFAEWYERACAEIKPLPHAAALATATATATKAGQPSVRMVLLKGYDARGFVFYTNYRSRKGRELARNARASLLFYWGALERQIRIEGRIVKVPAREANAYFATRPRGSQLSAWASPQSEVVTDRAALVRDVARLALKYPGQVSRPPHWGGYRLVPEAIEFWQGRADRLHDRLLYRRARNGRWTLARLAP